MIERIKRIFSGNTRKSPRWPVRSDVRCQVLQPVKGDALEVYLDNVSITGSSFFAKSASFEIDNVVKMEFQVSPGDKLDLRGKIVSQNVHYPSGTEALDEAIYRFSVSFETPLSNANLERLKSLPREMQN